MKKSAHQAVLAICGATVLAIESVAVYLRGFTDFSWFDDEGYVVLGLRSLLHGSRLYDQIYSQYGPFYFGVFYAIYASFHTEVTHDAARFGLIGFWLLSAILNTWSVFNLTSSWLFTAAGFLASIKILSFLTGSPGHPQEVCVALIAGILVTAGHCIRAKTATGNEGRVGALILLGVLLAALTLTKINIGLYATMALAIALLAATPPGRLPTVARTLLSAAAIVLPLAIMSPLLRSEWAQRASMLVVLTIAGSVLAAWRSNTPSFMTPRLWMIASAAFLATAALVIVPVLLTGTTLSAMLDMTVLQHRNLARNWYMVFPVYTEAIPLLSLGLAVVWVRIGTSSRYQARVTLTLNVLKVVLSAVWIVAALAIFVLGAKASATIIYNIEIPFCWLILVPPASSMPEDERKRFGRTVLCLLGALVAMYPLPVGGEQIAFAVVLTIPITCVFLDDAKLALTTMGFVPVQLLIAPRRQAIGMVLVLAITGVCLFDLRQSIRHYNRLTPLDLPGASRIHLDSRQAADYVWMVGYLSNSCDSYFSMPGIFSLYLWTKTESPTRWNLGPWFSLLDNRRQSEIVEDLSRYPKMCIVYNPDLVEFWRRGQDLSRSTVARYIQEHFTAAAARDRYVILARKQAAPLK